MTFRELLSAANEVLKSIGKDLTKFERWFHQPGTPIVEAHLEYIENEQRAYVTVTQSCPHPKTGSKQEPFQIPFSLELIGKNGDSLCPKLSCILEDECQTFQLSVSEKPTPIFMHGYSAPVILRYDYTLDDLATIVKYSDDVYCRWEASQNYSILVCKEIKARLSAQPDLEIKAQQGEQIFTDLLQLYTQMLKNTKLSPLVKAQILEVPSIRVLSQALDYYDFERLGRLKSLLVHQIAHHCQPLLEQLLEEYPAPPIYEPHPDQMQIRELRHAILNLLVLADEKKYQDKIMELYRSANNFDDSVSAFNLCLKLSHPIKDFAITDFYEKWKGDKAVFNFWLTSQAFSSKCTVDDLRRLESAKGYDAKNPNHVRSIFRTFIANLRCYHDTKGEGYQYIVDKIIEVSQFNPFLAHNHIAVPAFLDFDKLPEQQKIVLAKEMERLREGAIPAQTRDLVERILQRYYSSKR